MSQNPSASRRGNATRFDPIRIGPKYWPNGPRMTDDIIIIIMVPCSPTTMRYCVRAQDVVAGRQQLGPDRHREQPAGEEVRDHAVQVLDAHDLVVEREPEVLGKAPLGRVFLLVHVAQRFPGHRAQQVVEHAEPGQPPDGGERVAEHDRDVVGVREQVLRVPAGQEVAEQVAQEVADHRSDQAGVRRPAASTRTSPASAPRDRVRTAAPSPAVSLWPSRHLFIRVVPVAASFGAVTSCSRPGGSR